MPEPTGSNPLFAEASHSMALPDLDTKADNISVNEKDAGNSHNVGISPASFSTEQSQETSSQRPIYFVDMTDKKAARRVRNTMASRKHRQSKLERIRELERSLAKCEDERTQWRRRAMQLGWKES